MTSQPPSLFTRFALAVIALSGLTVSVSHAAVVPDRAGWDLVWQDEFESPSVNTSEWSLINLKNSYNNELQYYRPQQASIVDGALRITATNQPFDGKLYRSARLESKDAFSYGRFEARIDLPTTQGMWPAFWLLPNGTQWPTGGEIDILENRGSQPNLVSSAYHFQRNPGPCCGQHEYIYDEYAPAVGGVPVNFHDGYHTYAVEWEPGVMRFYVDDFMHWQVSEATHNVPIFATAKNIILNLAVGGDFGGNPNGSTVFPQHMDIDYVRVWQRPASQGLSGDYNGDDVVDAADYTVWRDSLGQSGIGLAADGSGNGTVGQSDYDIWRNAFGQSATATSVPEPSSFAAAAILAFAGVCRRR
jgi:beta-glucanase (GH16 family)